MTPTGTLKKGAKPTATFTLPNGAVVVATPQSPAFCVLSEWEAEGRCYRSYLTKDEAMERVAFVRGLVAGNHSKFADGYTLYVMELDGDTYQCVGNFILK
jgi:hypothetical protein